MAYGGDSNRGSFLNIINWVFCSISLAVVILRLISRRLLSNHWEVDDGFIVLAMAIILTRTIYLSLCIHLGFGQHLASLVTQNPENALSLTRLVVIAEAISLWTWSLPKLPVATLLVRLFGTYRTKLAPILYSLVAFLIAWVIILTVVTFVQCNPVALNWNPELSGTCWDPHIYLGMGYFATSYSAALDFTFAIYAICQISSLQMERPRKILIALSLGLGIPAGITTLYKISTIASLTNAHDLTWVTVPLEVWTSVESCALIIAAAVPMTGPVVILIGNQIKEWGLRISSSSSPSNQEGGIYRTERNNRTRQFSARTGSRPKKNSEEILLQEV
ncbi:hypothetical protein F4819DRAFT_123341 [Hypoxylon fuscum]|nr:hypothetical protein F4819DRAFT_123341 [Hypoxylon fuscum]